MCKEKRKVPKLRFPGFTEDWEQRKFSEITYLSGIKNKENKPYESYSISNEFGFIPQNEQFEHGGTMKTADKSMYYIVTQNSFAYNPARINVGSIGYYDKPDNVIVSSLYEVFKTTEIVNDKFLWHWFKSNQFNHLIEKYQEGGVRLYFYYDKLCKGAIELPTIDEQNKISNLLNGLDLFITLHQRKLEHLNLKKKALLQKLFPKNGECYPELRFPGFTDAWEQRKLSEVTAYFDNLRVPVTASDRVPGKIPYYGANGIQDYVSGHTHSGEFVLIAEDGANDLNDYPIQYVNGAIWVNNHAHVIAGYKEKLENKFLSYSLKTVKMSTFIVGGGRSKLNLKALLEIPISMPNHDEQCCIGEFIETIDKTITLHQRKLDHLQLQKKALLQQMFV